MDRTMDPAILSQWIGRSETRSDRIRAEPANLMEMTLDRDPVLCDGDPLPPLWHWLYFLHSAKLSDLGRDGHPALGGFLPPVALPRRMWAGGRLGFTAPLRIGAMATKTSTIKDVALKQGRSGALCFVTVRHEIATGDGPALWEEHDIVYREDPRPGDAAPVPPADDGGWDVTETATASEVMLFRYSALTFNGHRIHYDRDYARSVEGHAGLVVHGPLIATMLADLALRRNPGATLRAFEFRAFSPVCDHQAFTLNARRSGAVTELAAARPSAGLAMRATATV
ncbi:MaoC family dehydratase N-terminal domain-containing protein [Defluviimonas sp. D31]|uniref:FAS1-like dehydratase domain-containing protein n=1 Tax=Defluviimonas sp. D31 TaxID=3083253 RepID=UPI00296F5C0B|nr:MaoC family dehydratase N-terminal domain-containing protein [Defluviimonas sp. D31]MDW4551183.1 MaoC family dehydratase N-terminal domain-containing protein [Defluviimonas sp. D31]